MAALGLKQNSADGYFAAALSVEQRARWCRIADFVLAKRPRATAANADIDLPLGVVPHRATALKLSLGWLAPYGSVADAASTERVAASRLARSSRQSFGSSSRSSRTETLCR